MIKRVLATFLKEWHQIRRDLGGLGLIFLMPVLLITIMALVQDAPFKDYRDVRFEAIFINEDQGKVGGAIKNGLLQSKQFTLIEFIDGQPFTLKSAADLIRKGEYKFAIYIPKGISAEVVNSANIIANQMGKQMGLPASMPFRTSRDSVAVQVIFDPVSKPAFKVAILNAIEKFTTKIQSDIILERIAKLNPQPDRDTTFDLEKQLKSIAVKEVTSSDKKEELSKMNSVQHNVPAWAIFGMFFMVIIISESMINERIGGSWTRLKLIPGSFAHILGGKLLFYVLLGIVQFFAMLLVGVYLMPWVGLPSLQFNCSIGLLLGMVACISLCAVSLGILIGTLFNTSNQALPVAAISVVILSAVGGVWVPVEVLPPTLKAFSSISPMRWGLHGINTLFLRSGGLAEIWPACMMLIGGSLIVLFISWQIEHRRSS